MKTLNITTTLASSRKAARNSTFTMLSIAICSLLVMGNIPENEATISEPTKKELLPVHAIKPDDQMASLKTKKR
jgi:hypothetical protein